jgi:hypothetical protein
MQLMYWVLLSTRDLKMERLATDALDRLKLTTQINVAIVRVYAMRIIYVYFVHVYPSSYNSRLL